MHGFKFKSIYFPTVTSTERHWDCGFNKYREVFKAIDVFMALCFNATEVLPADNVWNEGKKLTSRPLHSIMLHGGKCGSCMGVYDFLAVVISAMSHLLAVNSQQFGTTYFYDTLEKRVFLYDTYVKYGSAGKCQRKFRDERVPRRQTIHNLVNKIRKTGILTDNKTKHKRRVLTGEKWSVLFF
jgi:hypothetical protein